jgi:hypothetical protein
MGLADADLHIGEQRRLADQFSGQYIALATDTDKENTFGFHF